MSNYVNRYRIFVALLAGSLRSPHTFYSSVVTHVTRKPEILVRCSGRGSKSRARYVIVERRFQRLKNIADQQILLYSNELKFKCSLLLFKLFELRNLNS